MNAIFGLQLTTNVSNDNTLQLSPIRVNADYLNKWNESCSDFLLLTRNGEPLRDTLYRVGGLGTTDIKGKDYFMLLKYVESYYEGIVLKHCHNKDPKHLAGVWCIIDKNGVEKVVFDKYKHPYLIKDSLIYSIDQKYYNIETGELYCYSSSSMETDEFLFLNNQFDDDKSMRGVFMINKKDGSFDLFPGK